MPSYYPFLEFSPNGQKLASTFYDPNVILSWDIGSASLSQTFRSSFWRHEYSNLPWDIAEDIAEDIADKINLAFSRNGKIIACGFGFHSVGIWDAESGAALQTLRDLLPRRKGDVPGIAFLPNGYHFALWHYDGMLQVWNVPNGSLLRTFHLDYKVYGDLAMAFSPIGQRLVAFDCNVKIWDTAFNSPLSQKLQGHDRAICGMTFSPNGQKLASISIKSKVCL